MFNPDFFPTPKRVIEKMLSPLNSKYGYLTYNTILEPSAGKGDIVDYIKERCGRQSPKMYCIEQEYDLQLVLSGKGYPVIGDDFLSFNDPYPFDLVVMNPPFSAGADHLLKAWDIVIPGGDVVCLLNAETISNPYTASRQLLSRIISQYGRYENIGQPFKGAGVERQTDVECIIIWLHKPEIESNVNFDRVKVDRDKEVAEEREFSANPLAHGNIIESLVSQYNHAVKLLAEMSQLQKQYRFYTKGVVRDSGNNGQTNVDLADKIDGLKKEFWNYVFTKTNLGAQTTTSFQKKFDEFAAQTRNMAFTVDSVQAVLSIFFLNKNKIMEDCLLSVFDKATSYHAKNLIHTEGWKTNKAYKVNRKIIMPDAVTFDPRWGGSWSFYYGRGETTQDFLRDIDKVLCYISGRDVSTIKTVHDTIYSWMHGKGWEEGGSYQDEFESEFFKIRMFKKGTVHLTFIDEALWNDLNIRAAKGKNWVGGGY